MGNPLEFLDFDKDKDGIPDFIENMTGPNTVIGTGESITTSDEQQGPSGNPAPGSVKFD